MSKLQEMLRDILTNAPPEPYTRKGEEMYHTLTKAADALDAMEKALRPLAEKFLSPDDIDKDMPVGARMCDDEDYDAARNDEQVDDVWIKRGDIRRAREALAKLES